MKKQLYRTKSMLTRKYILRLIEKVDNEKRTILN